MIRLLAAREDCTERTGSRVALNQQSTKNSGEKSMRPGQQNKRGRGRGNNNNQNGGGGGGGGGNNFNRKGSNPLTRTYDSSGPDIKIRGTAQHVAEKYATLARDAQSAGDRVMAENYLQHAEHYNRIIAAAQAQMQERYQRDDRHDYNEREQDDTDGGDLDDNGGSQPQMSAPQPQPREQREQRDQQPREQREPREGREPREAREPREGREPREPREQREAREQREQREPREPRRAPVQAAPAPILDENAVVDGTGPQPVIEGVPAEVALEEEGATAQPQRQTRRRTPGTRPRRPRRTAEGEEGAEAAASDAPALEDVASE